MGIFKCTSKRKRGGELRFGSSTRASGSGEVLTIFSYSKNSKVMRGVQSWRVLIKHDTNTSAVLDLWKEFKCLKSRGVGINEL